MPINKNDPYESDTGMRRRGQQRFEEDMQADPELAEGTASAGRIGLFAIAILAILGAVFYGLNNPSIAPQPESTAQTTTTTPPANTAQAPTPAPGQTTGSATSSAPASQSASPSINAAPSPSNSGTTQSGPPANN
ncbi:MAG: hypothetical protein HY242_08025 [Afipia sp.]|nr:hypothetical protein [Afipia sp.]